ncbi:hypothetical protein CXG81DRAFT_8483 [Caulochytrium protostelioides]|uniref:Ribosome assembly protein 1 n=2 Tax=Caulochytrium protostelioides TaxID=1555241 RepID=A0A4P9XFC7_9FUNG|nr:hypothetical protein CXG81DRAFT_8483 [Caulochytrium protostelioides]|eukprot:RKP04293.1 hypothetical protein CXG81DRAFT_8483 [Caulochytrium protostelioides]
MPAIPQEKLTRLQQTPQRIRNICVLAHIDHGKTTLSDSLLASNGIISNALSGKVRYMDSRQDEQERGITMKSSGISLLFQVVSRQAPAAVKASPAIVDVKDYLINLIDSPGHVDFSSEVTTAARICDGALVLVDVVEGVCTQTHTVLRQAWQDKLKPILVLNKLDRLITELAMTPGDAYLHLTKVVEQVNAVMGGFFRENWLEEDALRYEAQQKAKQAQAAQADVASFQLDDDAAQQQPNADTWILEDRDDSDIYFAPEKGNVIFASAMDGWAFRLDYFARLYAAKLGVKAAALQRILWGDFYLDMKHKRVLGPKGVKGRNLQPAAVQMVFSNIWTVYQAVYEETARDRLEKILTTLGIKLLPRDLRTKDARTLLKTVMLQWLPLSGTCLKAVVDLIPSPLTAQADRLPALHADNTDAAALRAHIPAAVRDALLSCDAQGPAIAYVSKMFPVPVSSLPVRKAPVTEPAPDVADAVGAVADRMVALSVDSDGPDGASASASAPGEETPAASHAEAHDGDNDGGGAGAEEGKEAYAMIGFTRVFSGTLRVGQTIHVLHAKYDPAQPETRSLTQVTIERLFMIMSRDLYDLDEVPAGSVCGILGLGNSVVKCATLASRTDFPTLTRASQRVTNLVRVAVEPVNPSELPLLQQGLDLLNQNDPSVEVIYQDSGEHVIACDGELHLERCLKDLREIYGHLAIHVSEPIVPYRETLSRSPALMLTNPQNALSTAASLAAAAAATAAATAATTAATAAMGADGSNATNDAYAQTQKAKTIDERQAVTMQTPNGAVRLVTWSTLLDPDAPAAGDAPDEDADPVAAEAEPALLALWRPLWPRVLTQLVALGPKAIGPNLLINWSGHLVKQSWATRHQFVTASAPPSPAPSEAGAAPRAHSSWHGFFDNPILQGFEAAVQAGPLCAEPMSGVAFFIEALEVLAPADDTAAATWRTRVMSSSGQLIPTMRDACRQAFLQWSPRLALATYRCELQSPGDVLGKVYGVLSRRRSRIVNECMLEGSHLFQIVATMPIAESFGFADELRKRTSGSAAPQLVFGGFHVLDEDPFWVPATEEEMEDLGDNAERDNIAKKYIDRVRKRKGMFVEEKIVEHAEKQRNMKNA